MGKEPQDEAPTLPDLERNEKLQVEDDDTFPVVERPRKEDGDAPTRPLVRLGRSWRVSDAWMPAAAARLWESWPPRVRAHGYAPEVSNCG